MNNQIVARSYPSAPVYADGTFENIKFPVSDNEVLMVMYRYSLSDLDLGHVRDMIANTSKVTPLIAETEDAIIGSTLPGSDRTP